jgi:hypothetical protein
MFYPNFTYHIIKSEKKNSMRRKELAEAFGWIFVDFVPLLYEKKRVARQFQIETWLDLSQLVMELGIDKTAQNKQNAHTQASYIV